MDLEYSVPVSTPATMARIRDLLDEVYRAFSEDHLLALRPPDVLVDLQNWYFTEFERQGNGEEPRALDRPDLDASCMTVGTAASRRVALRSVLGVLLHRCRRRPRCRGPVVADRPSSRSRRTASPGRPS